MCGTPRRLPGHCAAWPTRSRSSREGVRQTRGSRLHWTGGVSNNDKPALEALSKLFQGDQLKTGQPPVCLRALRDSCLAPRGPGKASASRSSGPARAFGRNMPTVDRGHNWRRMMRTRKPFPAKLKLGKNTASGALKRCGKPAVEAAPAMPLQPVHHYGEAQAERSRVVPMRWATRMLSDLEVGPLAACCEAWANRRPACQFLKCRAAQHPVTKGLLVKTSNNNAIWNLLDGIPNRAALAMVRFAAEFDLSHFARARPNVPRALTDLPPASAPPAAAGLPAAWCSGSTSQTSHGYRRRLPWAVCGPATGTTALRPRRQGPGLSRTSTSLPLPTRSRTASAVLLFMGRGEHRMRSPWYGLAFPWRIAPRAPSIAKHARLKLTIATCCAIAPLRS